jgi:hypothetical protein
MCLFMVRFIKNRYQAVVAKTQFLSIIKCDVISRFLIPLASSSPSSLLLQSQELLALKFTHLHISQQTCAKSYNWDTNQDLA